MLSDFVKSGKCNMIIDGQFGSTGKGLIANKIALDNTVHVAVGRLSPNAGHTFYYQGKKYVTKMLPVAGIIQERCQIFLSAGSVIDIDVLFKEMKEFDIDDERVLIHPRAAVVTKQDKEAEQDKSGVVKIASTQSGAGAARASKIMRKNPLAQGTPELQHLLYKYNDEYLQFLISQNLNILVETGQGFDLGLNYGYSYPHCTSIDVTPSAVLSDVGLHPNDLGNVMMVIRTFPIRVGNPKDENGIELGDSGPVYPDSKELSWDELQQIPEITTVTKRIRRVFTFSRTQYERAVKFIKPTHLFLNFINYLNNEEDIKQFEFLDKQNIKKYVGYGKYADQISDMDEDTLWNYFLKFR
jgi:Adenylosuccinate synthase